MLITGTVDVLSNCQLTYILIFKRIMNQRIMVWDNDSMGSNFQRIKCKIMRLIVVSIDILSKHKLNQMVTF